MSSASENRDDVLGVDVVGYVDALDVQLGDGRERYAPPLDDRPDAGDGHPPVLRLLRIGQHAETALAGVAHQDPVVGHEVRRKLPEPLWRLPEDHREEDEA